MKDIAQRLGVVRSQLISEGLENNTKEKAALINAHLVLKEIASFSGKWSQLQDFFYLNEDPRVCEKGISILPIRNYPDYPWVVSGLRLKPKPDMTQLEVTFGEVFGYSYPYNVTWRQTYELMEYDDTDMSLLARLNPVAPPFATQIFTDVPKVYSFPDNRVLVSTSRVRQKTLYFDSKYAVDFSQENIVRSVMDFVEGRYKLYL